MTGTDEHDLSGVAIGGGVLGAFGAFVRTVQRPWTWARLHAEVAAGILVGSAASVLVKAYAPQTPFEVCLFAGAGVGVFATRIIETIARLGDKSLSKVEDSVDDRLSISGRRNEPPAGPSKAGEDRDVRRTAADAAAGHGRP